MTNTKSKKVSKPSKSETKESKAVVKKKASATEAVSKQIKKPEKATSEKAKKSAVVAESVKANSERYIALTFHNVNQILKDEFARASGSQTTPSQYALLSAIASFDAPPSQTQINQLTGIDRSTTAEMLKRLHREGYVNKVRDPKDDRAHQLSLTDEGTKLLAIGTKAANRVEEMVTQTPGFQQAFSWATKFVKAHMFQEKPNAGKDASGEGAEESDEKDTSYSDKRSDRHTHPS